MKISETDFTTFGVVNKESSSTHPIEENFAEVIYIYVYIVWINICWNAFIQTMQIGRV